MATINLSKGATINLAKEAPGLKHCMVGLGWDPVDKTGGNKKKKGFFGKLFGGSEPERVSTSEIDCDASAFLLINGKIKDKSDVVCYWNKDHKSQCVKHMGDNITGEGDGDDEQIFIDLDKLPSEYDGVVITVNIYQARSRHQKFGDIQNVFIRLVDNDTGKEVCQYADKQFGAEFGESTAIIFGKLMRDPANGGWSFEAIGKGTNDDSIEITTKMFV